MKHYTVAQLADIYQLSEYTIREYIKQGLFGETLKMGTHIRVPESGLEIFNQEMARRKKAPVAIQRQRRRVPEPERLTMDMGATQTHENT